MSYQIQWRGRVLALPSVLAPALALVLPLALSLLGLSSCGSDDPSLEPASQAPVISPNNLIRGVSVERLERFRRSEPGIQLDNFERMARNLEGRYTLRNVTLYRLRNGSLTSNMRWRHLDRVRCDGQKLLPWFEVKDAKKGVLEVPTATGTADAEFWARLVPNDMEFIWRFHSFGRTERRQFWGYDLSAGRRPKVRLIFRDYARGKLRVAPGQTRCRAVYRK